MRQLLGASHMFFAFIPGVNSLFSNIYMQQHVSVSNRRNVIRLTMEVLCLQVWIIINRYKYILEYIKYMSWGLDSPFFFSVVVVFYYLGHESHAR